jgi:hypothetical protein
MFTYISSSLVILNNFLYYNTMVVYFTIRDTLINDLENPY